MSRVNVINDLNGEETIEIFYEKKTAKNKPKRI